MAQYLSNERECSNGIVDSTVRIKFKARRKEGKKSIINLAK